MCETMLIPKLIGNNCSGCRYFVKFSNNIEKYLDFSHAIITIGYKFNNVKKYLSIQYVREYFMYV